MSQLISVINYSDLRSPRLEECTSGYESGFFRVYYIIGSVTLGDDEA